MRRLSFSGSFFLQFSITNRCNLNCLHCYQNNHSDIAFPPDAFPLIIQQYKKILKYKDYRAGNVEIGGGEPLLANGLKSLLQLLSKEKIPSRILTNGLSLSKDNIREFKSLGLNRFQISIEGDKDIHNAIRGRETFEKALTNTELLHKSGAEVTISTTLSRINYKDIESICKLGPRISQRIFFSRLVPCGTGKSLTKDLLAKTEWFGAMNKIFSQRNIRNLMAFRDPTWIGFFVPKYIAVDDKFISGCAAGYHGLAIESDGSVYPCRRLPIVLGNIFRDDIVDIWNHPIMDNLRNRDMLKGKCGRCEYRWLCGGCRGIPYALKGDYLEEDSQCPWGSDCYQTKTDQ